jgi:hypothetical protein
MERTREAKPSSAYDYPPLGFDHEGLLASSGGPVPRPSGPRQVLR